MANVPISNITTTWNNVSTAFNGIKLNVTDTASAAGSLLMDLQVGGVSRFSVSKEGRLAVAGLSNPNSWAYIWGESTAWNFNAYSNQMVSMDGQTKALALNSGMRICWTATGSANARSYDLVLTRDAANTLAQSNGVNAQTFRLYNTFTDASNYERGFMRWNSNVLEIGAEGAGTGALRNVRLRAAGSTGDTGYFEASWSSGMSVNWNAGSNNSKTQWLNGNIQFSVGTVSNFLGINTSGSNRLTLADTVNIEVGTTTGTKIGTATTQKLSFYNATPVVQPSAVADATDVTDVVAQLNTLLARVRTLGLIAT